MDRFFELRLEMSTTGAGQAHLAVFSTDEHGQWMLLDDWTADNGQEVDTAIGEAATLVDGWMTHAAL